MHSKGGRALYVLKRQGGKFPHNQSAGEGRSSSTDPATRSGKACKSGMGGNSTGEVGRPTSHMKCK
jgi:hypothetical protein